MKNTSITNNAVTSIIEYLKETLVKLDLRLNGGINCSKLFELRSMPRLKVLNWGIGEGEVQTVILKMQLHHLSINQESLKLATSWQSFRGMDGFWDIQVKRL